MALAYATQQARDVARRAARARAHLRIYSMITPPPDYTSTPIYFRQLADFRRLIDDIIIIF
jgi:hypothetical protein